MFSMAKLCIVGIENFALAIGNVLLVEISVQDRCLPGVHPVGLEI